MKDTPLDLAFSMKSWPLFAFFFLILVSGLGFGCSSANSSATIGLEEFDQDNKAHGASFLVDSMHVRKPMPGHKDWRPLQFYYKHCSDIGEESYYSKTSYACTDPF